MPDLPPLDSLRVFEAAARLGSYQKAAEELNITPSAVSHRMRTLEAQLGVKLFERDGRGLTLSADGARFLTPVAEGIERLRAATNAVVRRPGEGPLAMTVAPGFAMRWLLPRLGRFQREFPNIEIRFDSTAESLDLVSRQLDLGIRFGFGEWPGLTAERLFSYDWVPVCAPVLAEEGRRLQDPSDLSDFTRLHVSVRPDDWRMWLLAAGVEGIDPEAGPVFESMPVALEAAAQGMGVLVAERHMIGEDVTTGRLVTLFDEIHVPSSGAFYLVYPEGGLRDRRLRAFRDWLFRERSAGEGTLAD